MLPARPKRGPCASLFYPAIQPVVAFHWLRWRRGTAAPFGRGIANAREETGNGRRLSRRAPLSRLAPRQGGDDGVELPVARRFRPLGIENDPRGKDLAKDGVRSSPMIGDRRAHPQ